MGERLDLTWGPRIAVPGIVGKMVADKVRALLRRYTGVSFSGLAQQPDREFEDCSNHCCKVVGFLLITLLISIESRTCFVEETLFFFFEKVLWTVIYLLYSFTPHPTPVPFVEIKSRNLSGLPTVEFCLEGALKLVAPN